MKEICVFSQKLIWFNDFKDGRWLKVQLWEYKEPKWGDSFITENKADSLIVLGGRALHKGGVEDLQVSSHITQRAVEGFLPPADTQCQEIHGHSCSPVISLNFETLHNLLSFCLFILLVTMEPFKNQRKVKSVKVNWIIMFNRDPWKSWSPASVWV